MSTNSNMEETYLLEVDSSQRDLSLYPYSNTYSVTINRPLYNVSKIKLIAARIPIPQYTIDSYNDTFVYDGTTITLDHRDYINGDVLAANVLTQMQAIEPNALTTLTFDSDTKQLSFSNTSAFSLTFDDTSPATVFGFLLQTYGPATNIVSNVVDLDGPSSLLFSMSADDRDDMKNEIYISDLEQKPMHYFGRIITVGYTNKRLIDHNGNDDPVRNMFFRGTEGAIETLDIKFFCNNFKQVFPYDFKLRNHILKFEVTCSLDKLSLNKGNDSDKRLIELPPKMKLDRFDSPLRLWGNKNIVVYGGAGIVFVLIILILASSSPKRLQQK